MISIFPGMPQNSDVAAAGAAMGSYPSTPKAATGAGLGNDDIAYVCPFPAERATDLVAMGNAPGQPFDRSGMISPSDASRILNQQPPSPGHLAGVGLSAR